MSEREKKPTQLSEHETREGSLVSQISAKPELIIIVRPPSQTTAPVAATSTPPVQDTTE